MFIKTVSTTDTSQTGIYPNWHISEMSPPPQLAHPSTTHRLRLKSPNTGIPGLRINFLNIKNSRDYVECWAIDAG